MQNLEFIIVCVVSMFAVIRGQGSFMDTQVAQEACMQSQCAAGDLCYVPHPSICNKFIMCSTNDVGTLYSQVMPCAFGTFWKRGNENACETSHLVDCPMDPCRQPGVKSYGHDDTNCRTYWRCYDGHTSRAECCKPYHSYNHTLERCVEDASCKDLCPILDREICTGRGVESLYFPDGNCKTFWNCTGSPHPVCCRDGMAYDRFSGRCVVNSSCTDLCPPDYQDICAKRGVKSYDLNDGNCRTYMKCNERGLDDPYCCSAGQRYDATLGRCVPTKERSCMKQTCPHGFHEECHLLPVAGDRTRYNNTLVNLIMPCPVGTVFLKCECDRDPNYVVDTSVCALSIHAKLPDLKNHGQATAALLMIGEYGQGEKGRGQMPKDWDGTTGINIPYFGTQAPYQFYLQIIFTPHSAQTTNQVLLSSCEYINKTQMPTIELSIQQLTDMEGNITLILSTPENLFTHEIPYKVGELYSYSLIYDGKKVASILVPNNRALKVDASYSPFTGPLTIDRGGLRFAHCRYEKGINSFVGTVSEIMVSKCLTPEMKDRLYPVSQP